MQLLEVQIGKWVRVVRVEGGRTLQNRLTQYGLYPGDCLRVLRAAPLGGPLLVEINGREIAIGRGVAQKILVEDTKCDSL